MGIIIHSYDCSNKKYSSNWMNRIKINLAKWGLRPKYPDHFPNALTITPHSSQYLKITLIALANPFNEMKKSSF